VNPQGFGYVVNESGDGRGDLYVAAENQSTAMHRDRVVARIIRDRVPLNAEAGNERKQGALDLDILEVRVRLDEQGKAIALEREQNDASHQLIEELMLLKGAEGSNEGCRGTGRIKEKNEDWGVDTGLKGFLAQCAR